MNDSELDAYVLKTLDEQDDGFIVPGQGEFRDIDVHTLFESIRRLMKKGILRRRECIGIAYEYVK